VHEVAAIVGQHHKGRDGAVGLLLRCYGGKANDGVGILHNGAQHAYAVFLGGLKALEKLAGRQHDLIGCLSPAAAPAHAIGYHAENAALGIGVRHEQNLVLLVFSVTAMNAGGRLNAVAG
jgi:hypothetical protein